MLTMQASWLAVRDSIYYFFFLMIRRPPRSTLFSLHDALPISISTSSKPRQGVPITSLTLAPLRRRSEEHTSELQHVEISYAVFCLKKKKRKRITIIMNNKKRNQMKNETTQFTI